jgi:hypothetical protein
VRLEKAINIKLFTQSRRTTNLHFLVIHTESLMRKITSLMLTGTVVLGSLMISAQPSYACGRFEPRLVCEARKKLEREAADRAQQVKIAAYRTQPVYIQARIAIEGAKKVVKLRPSDCQTMVERGSLAAAGVAAVNTASLTVGAVVRVIGKDAGKQLCKDTGLGY